MSRIRPVALNAARILLAVAISSTPTIIFVAVSCSRHCQDLKGIDAIAEKDGHACHREGHGKHVDVDDEQCGARSDSKNQRLEDCRDRRYYALIVAFGIVPCLTLSAGAKPVDVQHDHLSCLEPRCLGLESHKPVVRYNRISNLTEIQPDDSMDLKDPSKEEME